MTVSINNQKFGDPVAVAFRSIRTNEKDTIEVGAVADEQGGQVRILITNPDTEHLWYMNLTDWQASELADQIKLAGQVAFQVSGYSDLF